jgi:broad specificity phosphatase PhoE
METREEFSQKIHAELDELRAEIGRAQNRAEQAEGETQDRLQDQISMLLTKYERVGQAVQELEDAEGESWQDVKARVEGALSDLNKSCRNVLSSLA